jgi:hypothetical protein
MRRGTWVGLVGVGVGTLVLMAVSPPAAGNGAIGGEQVGGAGTWQATTPMHAARAGAVAVQLGGGRVLVIGGGLSPRSAEVYRSSDARWIRTGPLPAGSYDACAVRLTDGRVLVAGGVTMSGRSRALATASLYDPATRTWSATSRMSVGRERPTCVRLRDGRVLAVGGWTRQALVARRSAELYDPATGRWSPTGSLLVRHGPSSAVLLRGGDVLLAGGWGSRGKPQADSERYVVRTGEWQTAGQLGHPRWAPLFRLPGGRVLAIGGWSKLPSATVDAFVPSRGTWAAVAPLPGPRADAGVSAMNGYPLVLGGYDRHGLRTSLFWYQPGGVWKTLTPLPRRVAEFVTALLPGGRTLIAGGQTARPDPPPVRYAAVYTPPR